MSFIVRIRGVCRVTMKMSALTVLLCTPRAAVSGDQEFYEIRTNKTDFKYFELGKHVPSRSGGRIYPHARLVVAPDIGLPMEIDPRRGEHMYCNTQVYGIGGSAPPRGPGTPGGGVNSKESYYFPWTSNICETRDRDRDPEFCPSGRLEHLGQDCRPPTPTATPKYFVTAVDGGTVSWEGAPSGVSIKNDKFIWTYLHMDGRLVRLRDRVAKGQRLGKVWLHGSGAIHVHIGVHFKDRDAYTRFDPLPSLIVAYQKALGNGFRIEPDGNLAYDPKFEIREGASVACQAASARPSFGTETAFSFESLWCHNGSIVGLVRAGTSRKFVYFKPKSTDLEAAVRNAPVLFEGSDQSGIYEGTMRHYSLRCGNTTFDVSGRFEEHGEGGISKTVTVTGTRSSFPSPASCDPVPVNETLQFAFMGAYESGGGQPQPSPDPEPQPDPAPVTPGYSSYWKYFGSELGLEEDGDKRTFVFEKVSGVLEGHAQRGDTLFDGVKKGNRLKGLVTLFYKNCEPREFMFQGPLQNNGRRAVLEGTRDKLSPSCARMGTTRHRIELSHLRDTKPGPVPNKPDKPDAQPGEHPGGGVIASCADSEREPNLGTEKTHQFSSLWCLNRSIVGLVENENERQLVYFKPKPNIRDLVKTDPVVFKGTEIDGRYSGMGFWLDGRCGAQSFYMSGGEAMQGSARTIELRGRRPLFTIGCENPTLIDEVRTFTYIRDLGADELPVAAPTDFNLPEPANLDRLEKVRLYSTYYYVYQGTHSQNDADFALFNKQLNSFRVRLPNNPWCKAAVEGTVRINVRGSDERGFNFADTGNAPRRPNCQGLFSPSVNATAVAKSLWLELPQDAKFGFGNSHNIRLVPFRSIAADPRFRTGTVLYIPSLRDKPFGSSTPQIKHDGYVYVADRGGAIRGTHIDFFTGMQATNPFPAIIKSVPSGTFEAVVITDNAIRESLERLHKR